MRTLFLILMMFLGALRPSASEMVIVLADRAAIPAERKAAEELQKYLTDMTGHGVPIVGELPEGNVPAILVGQNQAAAELTGIADFSALAPDEIILRSVGNVLVVTGDRPRGTLYAAYELLERLGVNFWTSCETDVPSLDTVDLSGFDCRYAPGIAIRDIGIHGICWGSPDFAAQMRANAGSAARSAEFGGLVQTLGRAHTFEKLFPLHELKESHPEWTSMVNGQRGGRQLCLSNPELRKEFLRRTREWLDANPGIGVVALSQNDTGADFCTCPECLALAEREQGRQSGVLFDFLNEIAEGLEESHPGVLIETLAYAYTVEPPLVTMPHKNIIVRLCVPSLARPLREDPEQSRRIDAWGQAANHLAFWYYATCFKNYLLPTPNLMSLGDDFQYFRSVKCYSVFVQGDGASNDLGGNQPLRAWLTAKLAWDPSLDPDELRAYFMNGYYGPAAPYLEKVNQLVQQEGEAAQDAGILSPWSEHSEWLDTDVRIKLFRLGKQAVAAADDPVFLKRVRCATLSSCYAILEDEKIYNDPGEYGFTFEELQLLARQTLDLSRELGTYSNREFNLFPGFEAEMRERYHITYQVTADDLPEDFPEVDLSKVRILDYETFKVYETAGCWDDPAAYKGRAWHLADPEKWYIQHELIKSDAPVEVWVSFRLDKNNEKASGAAIGCGVWGGETPGGMVLNAQDLQSDAYTCVRLGEFSLKSGDEYFYCFPKKNRGVDALFCDRVILVIKD